MIGWIVTRTAGAALSVESEELLSSFLELETTVLCQPTSQVSQRLASQ
jgi:hypothetical protein